MAIKKRKPPYIPLPADALGHVAKTPEFKTRVKGSFKKETDINTIVNRHLAAGGAVPAPLKKDNQSPVLDSRLIGLSFAERINFAKSMNESFDKLPLTIRQRIGSLSNLSRLNPAQIKQLLAPPAPAAPPSGPPPTLPLPKP